MARALRTSGVKVRVSSARDVMAEVGGTRSATVDLVVIAARDSELCVLAERLAHPARAGLGGRAPVLHTAGALGSDVLDALRPGHAVGVAHPLVSFASSRHAPPLVGAGLTLSGDDLAVAAGRRLARALGMRPLTSSDHEPARYHAAAALMANGAAALAATSLELLVGLGYGRRAAEQALAALLASVAHNVAEMGLPAALSGPVRRGDVETVRKHLRALPVGSAALYRALVAAQIPLAEALGEAARGGLEALKAEL